MNKNTGQKISLKAARANMDLNRAQAAEKIGVSVNTLRNWELGVNMPNVKYIPNIEKAYGMSWKDIFYSLNTVKPCKKRRKNAIT